MNTKYELRIQSDNYEELFRIMEETRQTLELFDKNTSSDQSSKQKNMEVKP